MLAGTDAPQVLVRGGEVHVPELALDGHERDTAPEQMNGVGVPKAGLLFRYMSPARQRVELAFEAGARFVEIRGWLVATLAAAVRPSKQYPRQTDREAKPRSLCMGRFHVRSTKQR